jgi:cytochrome c-type biogenesis protein CcmH
MMVVSRRQFVGAIAASFVQQATRPDGSRPTMSGPMDDNAYKSVALPPKPGASASMSVDARDALEHRLHCQCGCTLDIYTCRTTDFTCPVSPAMHKDVMQLVAGGYSADEIITAFQVAYGDKVLMAPPRIGFNWAGYLTPFAALAVGAVIVATLISRWRRVEPGPVAAAAATPPAQGTPDEMRRLDDAIRRDDQS